ILVSHGGRLVVAYTGTDGALNVFSSPDGDFHGDANQDDKHVLGQHTSFAPSIASFDARLFIGWTGDDAKLNWAEVLNFGSGGLAAKTVSTDSSADGVSLLGFGDKFIVSWRGFGNTNVNHAWLHVDQLDALRGTSGHPFPSGQKTITSEQSNHTPTVA